MFYFACLAIILLAVVSIVQHGLLARLRAENKDLNRILDQSAIHRDAHGRFIHPAGPSPLSDYEEL